MALDPIVQKQVIGGKISYSQKPKSTIPAPSQLNQGGEGGGNVNIGDASGQANQGSRVGSNFIRPGTTPTSPSAYTPQTPSISTDSLKKQGIIKSALQPIVALADVGGEGAKALGSDISNSSTTIGNKLFGEGTFPSTPDTNYLKTAQDKTSQATTGKANVGDLFPESSNGTMGSGTFNTPTGGSAIVTRGDGSPVFSQSQQFSLQNTINRNADPAFQAEMAKQAGIVNDRIAQTKLGDERRAGNSLSPRAEYDAALASGNPARIMHAEDIYKTRLGVDSKNNAENLANQRFQYEQDRDQQKAQVTALGEKHKSRAEGLRSYYSALSDNEKAMGTPAQRYQIAKSHFGTVTSEHLPDILGSSHDEYSKLTNQKDQADFLARAGITL